MAFYENTLVAKQDLAEKEIKTIENEKEDIRRFKPLIKLYDRADIINDIA